MILSVGLAVLACKFAEARRQLQIDIGIRGFIVKVSGADLEKDGFPLDQAPGGSRVKFTIGLVNAPRCANVVIIYPDAFASG